MKHTPIKTWTASIYIAGDIATIKHVLREECMREGLCVTVEPIDYIYTGGAEAGARIGFDSIPTLS